MLHEFLTHVLYNRFHTMSCIYNIVELEITAEKPIIAADSNDHRNEVIHTVNYTNFLKLAIPLTESIITQAILVSQHLISSCSSILTQNIVHPRKGQCVVKAPIITEQWKPLFTDTRLQQNNSFSMHSHACRMPCTLTFHACTILYHLSTAWNFC